MRPASLRALLAVLALALAASPGLAAAQQSRPQPVAIDYAFPAPAYALAQQRLFAQTLENLKPSRPGVRDVYILAAGLHGGHVFENEAAEGAAALSLHFSSEGRTIVLSNDHHPGPSIYPSATPEHIEAAIGRIAEAMDKDNDVAVIFLTSHGAPNAGIVGFEPTLAGGEAAVKDYMITPGALRGALDSAGIKNRIIILSACFSGQFIPTLSDPRTIVITAASADRTSFGCQAQRDWTYFGDAFFNQSLPQSGGLLAAFERAKGLISSWETQGALTPSQPQSYLGAQSQKYLAEIERVQSAGGASHGPGAP
jgi:hypothetical protein